MTDNYSQTELLASIIGRHEQVGVLGLSVRTSNCLKRAGVVVIGDLLRLDSHTLTDIQNLGRRGVEEIRAAVKQHELNFDEELYDDP